MDFNARRSRPSDFAGDSWEARQQVVACSKVCDAGSHRVSNTLGWVLASTFLVWYQFRMGALGVLHNRDPATLRLVSFRSHFWPIGIFQTVTFSAVWHAQFEH